ncbi:unnamed protein product, partial [Rotaria magnacalcarata]
LEQMQDSVQQQQQQPSLSMFQHTIQQRNPTKISPVCDKDN